jgi:predicted nucleic acid-binding protein
VSVYLDTAPLIYLVEGTPARSDVVESQIRNWIESGEDLVTSCMTLMELLVHPKRRGDRRLENQYRLYLERLLALPLQPIDERVAEKAAEIRARHGFKSPDSLQLAAAVCCGCSIFYSNDQALMKFDELDVVLVG